MGRHKAKRPPKGTRVSLEELGIAQGRARLEQSARKIIEEGDRITAEVNELMDGLSRDPPSLGANKGPDDPARVARVAQIALRSLKTSFDMDVDFINRYIAEAIVYEQRENDALALQSFRDALAKAYDSVGIEDLWPQLVNAGLVTTDPVPFNLEHNWIAYPVVAERDVSDYFDRTIQQFMSPTTRAYSDIFESLVKACGAEPVPLPTTAQLDKDFPTGPTGVWVKTMNADLNDTKTRQYAPIRMCKRAVTSVMIIVEIQLPRSKAIPILRGFAEIIEPHVRAANYRQIPFDVSETSALFYMAPQTVPHFLGSRTNTGKKTGIANTLIDMNEYGDSRTPIRRNDLHIEILHRNVQCISVLRVRPPLCAMRLDILKTDIKRAGRNDESEVDDDIWGLGC